MAECDTCGTDPDGILHLCNYCGANLCPDHRLSEKHDCLPPKVLQELHQDDGGEPEPRPPGSNHKTCKECSKAVAPGKELCPDCRSVAPYSGVFPADDNRNRVLARTHYR
jgi:hypothetical protein